jgi:hypothetical protein
MRRARACVFSCSFTFWIWATCPLRANCNPVMRWLLEQLLKGHIPGSPLDIGRSLVVAVFEVCSGERRILVEHVVHAKRDSSVIQPERWKAIRPTCPLFPLRESLLQVSITAAHRILRLLPSRAIAFGLQVMSSSPFPDAYPRLQAIFVCRSEVNSPVQPAHCRFLCCSETGWKAAVHAGQKI